MCMNLYCLFSCLQMPVVEQTVTGTCDKEEHRLQQLHRRDGRQFSIRLFYFGVKGSVSLMCNSVAN